jgi:hypothetical protein
METKTTALMSGLKVKESDEPAYAKVKNQYVWDVFYTHSPSAWSKTQRLCAVPMIDVKYDGFPVIFLPAKAKGKILIRIYKDRWSWSSPNREGSEKPMTVKLKLREVLSSMPDDCELSLLDTIACKVLPNTQSPNSPANN